MNAPWEVIEDSWLDADHIQLQDNLSGQICTKLRYPRHAIRQEGRKAAGFPQVRLPGRSEAPSARQQSSWWTGPKPPPHSVYFGQGPSPLSFIYV